MLVRFYALMGNAPDIPGALNMMAEALTTSATPDQINVALNRAMRECRFPVRLPDIFMRIPGHEIPGVEAEQRAAWDVLIKFVDKWVQSDVHGNYAPDRGCRPGPMPVLSERILDTVRRTGGWRAYKCITASDFPFQQKRFFEEYLAWNGVNSVAPALIETMPKNLLKM
jgi:hypothetical protein